MTLDQAPRGRYVTIKAILDGRIRRWLLRFGLVPGCRLLVLENLPGGPVVIRYRRQEIALGKPLAEQILTAVEAQAIPSGPNYPAIQPTLPPSSSPPLNQIPPNGSGSGCPLAVTRPQKQSPPVSEWRIVTGRCLHCPPALAGECPLRNPSLRSPSFNPAAGKATAAKAEVGSRKGRPPVPFRKEASRALGPGEKQKLLVLAGNPNVGKSAIFNYLTGLYVDVSNYPGTTVEVTAGTCGSYRVVDAPGVYGIAADSDEEKVAQEAFAAADVILNVVDATHLERDLFLTLQLLALGKPMLVALNLIDEARRQGIEIDTAQLSRFLGVPVIPTVAVTGFGLEELKRKLGEAKIGKAVVWPEGGATQAGPHWAEPNRGLDRGGESLYHWQRAHLEQILQAVAKIPEPPRPRWFHLNHLVINPWTGFPILGLILFLAFYFFGVLVAQGLVGITEGILIKDYYLPLVTETLGKLLSGQPFLSFLLVGEFGLLTMTAAYLLGLLLPLVFGFYLALALLEDSGYLPRVAVLLDRPLNRVGLNGRAIIPFILGLGCVTMALITTRILYTRRERRIAAILLSFVVPCSAQLGVVTGLLARTSAAVFLLYTAFLFGLLIGLGILLHGIVPGRSSGLLLDLPPLRWPRWGNVLRKSATKAVAFLHEAGPLFVYGALALSLLQATGYLDRLEDWLVPLTVSWLRLPAEAAKSFLLGFVRRDFGAAGLYALTLTPRQSLVAALTITLFVPCLASVTVLLKEQGWLMGLGIWGFNLLSAFFIGGLVARLPLTLP